MEKYFALLTKSSKSPASIAKSNKQLFGVELRSEADCEYPLDKKAEQTWP